MDKDEEVFSNFFIKAFNEVVVPVLEEHDERFDKVDQKLANHDRQLTEIQETLGAHTVSLMQIEKIYDLMKEVLSEVKDNKAVLKDYGNRIEGLELKVV